MKNNSARVNAFSPNADFPGSHVTNRSMKTHLTPSSSWAVQETCFASKGQTPSGHPQIEPAIDAGAYSHAYCCRKPFRYMRDGAGGLPNKRHWHACRLCPKTHEGAAFSKGEEPNVAARPFRLYRFWPFSGALITMISRLGGSVSSSLRRLRFLLRFEPLASCLLIQLVPLQADALLHTGDLSSKTLPSGEPWIQRGHHEQDCMEKSQTTSVQRSIEAPRL